MKRIAHVAKISADPFDLTVREETAGKVNSSNSTEPKKKKKSVRRKGFINDSEDEDVFHSKPKVLVSGSVTNTTILKQKELTDDLVDEEPSKKDEQVNKYKGRLREGNKIGCLNEQSIFNKLFASYAKEDAKIYVKAGTSKFTKNKAAEKADEIKRLDLFEDQLNENNEPPLTLLRPSGRNVDWDKFISVENPDILKNLSVISPVEVFRGAPLANVWKEMAILGLYIELRNPFARGTEDVYWIGSIIHFAGYRALVKFESFSDTEKQKNHVTWISFCSSVAKPVGWCFENEKTLDPGPIVLLDTEILQEKLKSFYENPPATINSNHLWTLKKEVLAMKTFDHSVPIECVDMKNFDEFRLARISTIIGDRFYVQFYNDEGFLDTEGTGFWFSYRSEYVHPFGWSQSVGVQINGNPRDLRCNPPTNCFPSWPDSIEIEKGMRLEVRHPIRPNVIVGAIIQNVLNHGYFIVQTREMERVLETKVNRVVKKVKVPTRVRFVFHVTSPFIFEQGFGAKHGIPVDYIEDETYRGPRPPLRLNLLPPQPPHSFSVGEKFEAIDRYTQYAQPATIKKIADHMLYIYFDHWNSENESNYSWVDTQISECYPLGYSEMIGLDFQVTV